MKRWLWLTITGLIVGVALASFLARDPGYALLQVSGYRLETSFVGLVLAVIALIVVFRLIVRLVRIIFGVVPGFSRWLGKRKEEQNLELIQSSLDDALNENLPSLLGKVGQLEKSSWHSESRAKQMKRWLLKRQIRASEKAGQLNKLWSKAAAPDKADPTLKVYYIKRLYQLGRTNELDVALLETANSFWHDALNDIIAVHRPKDAEQLLERLIAITASDTSGAISRAVVLLNAASLESDAGDSLLIEAHKNEASDHFIKALGARRFQRGS